MLWNLVDIAAVLGAVALVVAFGPGVLGMAKWRQRFQRRIDESAAKRAPSGRPPAK